MIRIAIGILYLFTLTLLTYGVAVTVVTGDIKVLTGIALFFVDIVLILVLPYATVWLVTLVYYLVKK